MTETIEAPAFPIVKVKKLENQFEGIFFQGGQENADAIIAWAKSHGDEAFYSTNNDAIWTETIRIKAQDVVGTKNRFAIVGSWIVRDEEGDYRRINTRAFKDLYTIIGNPAESLEGNAWVDLAASLCHEVNRELQIAAGDDSVSPHWKDAPNWQKVSALEGIVNALNGQSPRELHESWMAHKIEDGWVYGETKNAVAKTHPCLVPYEELDEDQKLKDKVFSAIVKTFKDQALLG